MTIDIQRPHMLHIGDYVKITSNVTVLCHDYSRSVFLGKGLNYANVGEAGITWIGDNVFLGMNCTILMGSHVGSNSIVGAGAVVSGEFPDGSVIAGNPARVICTIEELYKKRCCKEVEAAKLYVQKWREKYQKDPSVYDMTNSFAWMYLPHTLETVESYPELFRFNGVDRDFMIKQFLDTEPLYESFEKFVEDCTE